MCVYLCWIVACLDRRFLSKVTMSGELVCRRVGRQRKAVRCSGEMVRFLLVEGCRNKGGARRSAVPGVVMQAWWVDV